MTFLPFYSSSWYCSINTNKTGNPSLLSLWTVSAQQAPLPVPVRNISIQDQESLSAPGPDCPCQARASSCSGGRVKHRTATPNPGLFNPESFMETSRSAGALIHRDSICNMSSTFYRLPSLSNAYLPPMFSFLALSYLILACLNP